MGLMSDIAVKAKACQVNGVNLNSLYGFILPFCKTKKKRQNLQMYPYLCFYFVFFKPCFTVQLMF